MAVPCSRNQELQRLIDEYAEVLRERAHELGSHGLSEQEFRDSGIFRGVIERLRGQFAAAMSEKREFIQHVLNHIQDLGLIREWESAGGSNRHDYVIRMLDGRNCVIELKGCLDGNNTTIFDRPGHADEFVIWSVCTNPSADPQANAWSGIHTRLSAEIIHRQQQVDGLIVWDMACGTLGRPCPKVHAAGRLSIGPYQLPPPCLYRFPRHIPSPRNNPAPPIHTSQTLHLFPILQQLFGMEEEDVFDVGISVALRDPEVLRMTEVSRAGTTVRRSAWTPIRRL
jgi:hypothetical protein